MEEGKWKNDEAPYLVFSCTKCKQYSYVKTTQKTKKCLRCGRTHQVKNILNNGKIVYGMSQAVYHVKKKQNELALMKIGKNPDFTSELDYQLLVKNGSHSNHIPNQKRDYYAKLKIILFNLYKQHKEFPRYLIELSAEIYQIPSSEIKLLIAQFRHEGFLISSKNKENYFTLFHRLE